MSTMADQLAQLLSSVRRPGDFYAAGTIELRAPRLEVDGRAGEKNPGTDARFSDFLHGAMDEVTRRDASQRSASPRLAI
jgi:hypothetical protein